MTPRFTPIGSALVLFAVISLSTACSDNDTDKSKSEPKDTTPQGVIVYEVDYPEIDKNVNNMYALLPKTFVLTYKGNTYKTEVGVKVASFKTTLISDSDTKSLTALYELSSLKWYSQMSEAEVEEFLKEFPTVTYSDSSYSDTLLGLQCEFTTGIMGESERNMELISSTDIQVKDPNWCNPYHKLDGMLMRYEIEYYGVLMSFNAVYVNRDTILPDNVFEIPSQFERVPYKDIKQKLEELFSLINH